jgi:hypothetical protein
MKKRNPSSQDREGSSFLSAKMGRSFLSNQIIAVGVLLLLSSFGFSVAKQEVHAPGKYLEPERIYHLTVASNKAWTDSGYDVHQGEEIRFHAAGGISLQLGNPMAYCGPDGYDLKTLQQPLPDSNIGALVGKVVLLISIEIDEETGEEKKNELVKLFFIGSNQRIVMPIDGRLYLGMNENLVEDNSGQYAVEWQLIQKGAEAVLDES